MQKLEHQKDYQTALMLKLAYIRIQKEIQDTIYCVNDQGA